MAIRTTVSTTASLSLFAALTVSSIASAANYQISSSTGTFTPSFRDQPNTTYFGWGSGSFDGATNDELIDSPAATLGQTSLAGINLVQNHANDILSSTNNIYTAGFTLDLSLTAPTAGTPGTGFTTIILQGKTAFGAFGSLPAFADLGGETPDVAIGTNLASSGQFWAKYEIPGNASTYTFNITGGTFLSLAELKVDTVWSSNGFSPDTAIAPEPTSLGLLAAGTLIARRRRA